jgi:hypothetical protein
MGNSKAIKPEEVALSACTFEPVAGYDLRDHHWTMRVTLELPSPRGFLPLFVHVYKENGKFTAEVESDQTNYSGKGEYHNIKRGRIKGLKFFTREG